MRQQGMVLSAEWVRLTLKLDVLDSAAAVRKYLDTSRIVATVVGCVATHDRVLDTSSGRVSSPSCSR